MPDALAPPVQLIIGRGLLTAESIAQELRERLALDLEQDYRRYDFSYRLNRAREILRTFEPLLADNLLAVDLAAWIAGYDELANDLPAWAIETFGYGRWGEPPIPPSLPGMLGDAQPEDVRFPLLEQAVKSLVERNILTREEFDRQADNAKSRAFTIAGGLTRDTIAAIHELLVDDVAEGASLTGFRERVEQALGASPIGPAHLENVFRTNVQAAFRDGREALASHPIVDEVFPYQRINAVHDSRTRPEHLALESLGIDGTNVYRRDDLPFWNTFTPPWDFNCRCNVTLLTVEAAAQAGVVEAQEWLRTGVKPPLESRLPHIPFPGNPGFGQRSGRAVAMSSACSCGGYVMRMAGRWVTLKPHEDQEGGAKAFIRDGIIVAGPKDLEGKSLDKLDKKSNPKRKEPKPKVEAPKPEPKRSQAPETSKVRHPDARQVRKVDVRNPPGSKAMREAVEKMGERDRKALREYTSGEIDYRGINAAMRSGKALKGKSKRDFERVSAAIEKAGKLPEGTRVYRGLHLSAEQKQAFIAQLAKQAESGEAVELSGLQSTSADPAVAASFSRGGEQPVVLEIVAQSGAYLGDVSAFDIAARKHNGTPENEVLLPHGKRYRVIAVQQDVPIGKRGRKGSGYTVIQLEEVDAAFMSLRPSFLWSDQSGFTLKLSSPLDAPMRMAWDESQVERDERGRFSKIMKSSEPEKELRGIARQEAVKRAAERLAKAGASHGIVKTPEEWEQAIGASDKFETDYAFNTYFGPASSPSRFESRQAAGFDPRADTRQPEHEELAWKEYQEDMAKWRKRFEDSFDAYPHLAQAANWTVDGDDLSSSVVQLRNAGYSHEDALSELFDDTVGVAFRAAIVEAVKDLAASKGKTVDEESIKVIAAEEFLSPNWDRAFGKGADHHPALWDNLESPKYSIDPAKLEEIFAKEKEKIPKLAQKSAKAIWRDARDEIITEGQGENPTRMAWDESEHPRDESGQFTEDGEDEGDFAETDAGRRIVQQARLSAKAASKSLGIEVDEEVFGGEDAEGWHALNDDKRREHLASYAELYAEDALADPDGKLFRSEFKAMVAERLTMVAEQIAGDAWYRQTSAENLADSFAYGELRGKPLQAFQEFRRSYFEEHPEAFDDLVQEFTSDMESNLEHDPEDDDSRKLLHKLAKLAESRDVAGVLALLDKEEQSTERHDQEAMQWASETTEFGDYLKDRIIARGKLHESERDVAHSILEDRESPLYREMKERLKTRIFEGLKGAL